MRWDSFIYYFAVGGVILLASIALAWMSGDQSWKRKEDRRCLVFLLVGFLMYFALYLLWQLYAMGVI
jgi:hypothetical protein